jgi:hypothetical protein
VVFQVRSCPTAFVGGISLFGPLFLIGVIAVAPGGRVFVEVARSILGGGAVGFTASPLRHRRRFIRLFVDVKAKNKIALGEVL